MNVPFRFCQSPVLVSICRNYINRNKNTSSSFCSAYRVCCKQNDDDHDLYYSHHISSHSHATGTLASGATIRFLTPLLGGQHQHALVSQPSSQFHTLQYAWHHPNMFVVKLACQHTATLRHKSKKKQRDTVENDSDSDIDDSLDDDDFEAPSHFKVQTIHSPSLRVDAILSKALGLSRNRLEEIFFGPGFLLNGTKMLKKAGKMDEGDYVDVITEKVGDQVKVKRVKLLKIGSEKTSTDKLILKVRIWKAPFLINRPDRWKPDD